MGPAEDDERPGETGPEDGSRAGDAPASGAEPIDGTAANGSGNGTAANGSGNGGGSAAALWSAPDWDPATPAPALAAPPVAAPRAVETVPPDGRPAPATAPTALPTAPPVPPTTGPTTEPPTRFDPRHPAPRTHRWGLGAYLVVEAIFLGVSLLISQLFAADEPEVGALVLAVAAPTVLAAAAALLITRLRGNGPVADLGLRPTWRDAGLGVAYGVGGLVVTIPASVLFLAIAGEDETSAVGATFGQVSASLPWAIAVFLIVVLVAPLCEEILYRGLLWGGLERMAGPRVAFGVSTLLFALAHFEFTRTPLLLVVALPIAIARYRTGRLTSSIVAHQINNLLPGVVLMLSLLGVVPLA